MAIRYLALAGNICSGFLTARFLGPDGRGELAALIIAPAVLAPFCTLGIHAAVVFNLRSDPSGTSRYFGSATIISALAAFAGMVIGIILVPMWLIHYSRETIAVARVMLLVLPFAIINYVFVAVLEANGRFGLANSVLYIQSLTTTAILGLLAWSGHIDPRSAAYVYNFLTVPVFLFLAAQACRIVVPRLSLAAPYPRRLLRYGLRFCGVEILSLASGYLDQVVIVFMLEPEAVGAYAVALSLSRVLGIAQSAVWTVVFPSVAGRDVASVVEMVGRAARVTTVVNIVAAVVMALAGPSLLLLLYGSRFGSAVAPFLVLLVEAVVTNAARTLAQAFSGSGRPDAVTTLELAGVVTSLAAMLVLVPQFGIVGAACASLLAGCARVVYVVARFHKVLGVKLPRLLINQVDIAWLTQF